MTAAANKVRIYDLARELKQDTKRLIEEVRREGLDVSVPSNSVPKEVADKIRNKYFPKKETAAPRAIKVVKRAAIQTEEATELPLAATDEMPDYEPERLEVAVPVAPSQDRTVTTTQLKPRILKLAAPPPVAEVPESLVTAPFDGEATNGAITLAPEIELPPPDVSIVEDESPAPALEQQTPEPEAKAAVPTPTTGVLPPANQVRKLTLTRAALEAGVRPGERIEVKPVAAPAAAEAKRGKDAKRGRDRRGRGGRDGNGEVELRATPGETATPRITYTPPSDSRPKGRNTRRPGGGGGGRPGRPERGGRFHDRDLVASQPVLSLEDRLRRQIDAPVELQSIRLVEGATVKDLSEKMGVRSKDIVTILLQRGVFATVNQTLNQDVAVELGQRFGFAVSFVPFEEMIAEEEIEDLIEKDADDVETERSPVVTVMGHVDHGKTSLLDAIRSTDVAAGEAGGITQHIGAYSVKVPDPGKPGEQRRIVFLDTPGHEAFTMMRARGAKATDVVVLVVAADDGVMPQTIEAIEHSRAAGVPIVVAINKVDKPDANPEKVKQELSQYGLTAVEWGGETEMVAVSAKQRQNLDNLLETILLTADILDLKASPTRLASGVVLEAKLDKGRGAVATVLIQQGTLRLQDPFIVGQVNGKVRALYDDRGGQIMEVPPATPVEVLGLQGVPQAGDAFQVVSDITRAQQIAQHRQMLARMSALAQSTKRGLEALGQAEYKELLVVIKADVQGSVEVLRNTLEKLSTERVKVKVVRSGVGAITESDVLLASATQADTSSSAVVIIGFNVRPDLRASELAKQEGVDIRLHSVIYKVEEEIRAAMIGILDAIERETILGKANVLQVFRVTRVGSIAGCMVTDGIIRRTSRARLIRDGVVAWEGSIGSLKREKNDASEVRSGFECGIGLEGFNDIKEGDQIEAFVIEKIAATEL